MKIKPNIYILSLLVLVTVAGCGDRKAENKAQDKELPILGRKEIDDKDTIYHTIADYKFVNQDSSWVTPDTFKDKIYVADFFFTSCPTICPKMKAQMLRVYDSIQSKPDVLILSHTIDPKHDTVAVLKEFAERLEVSSDKWHFVTGDKDDIYKVGQTSYMVTASEDSSAPGGYLHSGAFVLVDKGRRVRGVYDGTKPEQVDRLIRDIEVLRGEYDK